MVARLLLALLASVAATVFLVVGLVGYTDGQRAAELVLGAEGKRLTYKTGSGHPERLRKGRKWHRGPRRQLRLPFDS